MTMVSELVLTRNQLLEIARRQDDHAFKTPLQRLSHITAELQDGVMKTRMQPIGNAWGKLPRVVRDLSAELGKRIELVMEGADTELDRQLLEQIKDPLTHMVRNSADHGIELPHERRLLGKAETGCIRLTASHESGSIAIRISDDGKGLDIGRIRRKAEAQGLATPAELDRMTDAQIARFIFHPGFSTAETVTSVSGRGVGMDVVKTNIDAIGGTVEIASEAGKGTTFSVKIPLTLAIVSALIVAVGEQRFAVPQVVVRELVRVRPGSDHAIETLNGASVLRLRERLLPVVQLSGVMGLASGAADTGFVVVTQVGQQQFGILVDGVLQTEEIVVKPMSAAMKSLSLFSGNTILGDGAVVLIIDPNGLAKSVGKLELEDKTAADAAGESEAEADERQTILVFRGGGGTLKAVPLSLVTRLEEIDGKAIEWNSGKPLVQYPRPPDADHRRQRRARHLGRQPGADGHLLRRRPDDGPRRGEHRRHHRGGCRHRAAGGHAGRAGLGRARRPRHRVHRSRALPAAGLPRLAERIARPGPGARRPCPAHRELALHPRHAGPRHQGGRLHPRDLRRRRRRAGPDRGRARVRGDHRRHRERNAGRAARGRRSPPRRDASRRHRLRAAPGHPGEGPRGGPGAGDRQVRQAWPDRRAQGRRRRDDGRSRMIAANANGAATDLADEAEFVTFLLGDQQFGLPIQRVHEVFAANQITSVPLAPPMIKGLLNLRGRVVTAVCLRSLLGLSGEAAAGDAMAIGIESGGEQFALLVDRIGDVMRLPAAGLEPNPIHMTAGWQSLSRGVYRLDGSILVILELDKLISTERLAA